MSPRLHADDVVIKRINKLSKNMCAKRRKEVPKQKGGEMGGVAMCHVFIIYDIRSAERGE